MRRLKTPRAAGVAGLLFSALFLAAMRLHPLPGRAPPRSPPAFFQLVVLVFPLWVAAISVLILASGRVPDWEDDEA